MVQLGLPLLILDAPQNAPPYGVYHMALYDGQYGPHQVDWYWQPRAFARIPQQTRLLFDRVGLPISDSPPHFDYQPVPERDPHEVCTQQVNFFWVMLLIAAKYVARFPPTTASISLPLWSLLTNAQFNFWRTIWRSDFTRASTTANKEAGSGCAQSDEEGKRAGFGGGRSGRSDVIKCQVVNDAGGTSETIDSRSDMRRADSQ